MQWDKYVNKIRLAAFNIILHHGKVWYKWKKKLFWQFRYELTKFLKKTYKSSSSPPSQEMKRDNFLNLFYYPYSSLGDNF